MQPNQVPKRSVPSSELFNKTPIANPESQQEQWLPAVPLVGEVLQASHPALAPSTWELHPCTCTSIKQLKVLLLSSSNIPKDPDPDWGLSLTERRGAFHFPDGFTSLTKAAATAYQHLHKQASCSNSSLWASFPFSCFYYGKYRSFW